MRSLLILVFLTSPPVSAQTVIYVDRDASGMNNGSSWNDAYKDLQDALVAAISGDEIWVAEGLYKPTHGSDRTISFDLTNGLALYGGFNGTESSREERDWTLYESILSGDVGVGGDSLDNSYHVVTAASLEASTILDGFLIRRGRANGSPPFDSGGGVYAPNSDISIRNSTFRWNAALAGGAIYLENGSPTVEDCLFDDNVGVGAIFDSGGSPALRRFTINMNGGAGIVLFGDSQALLEDCVVENASPLGIWLSESDPVIRRCAFRIALHETGDGGGGLINDSNPVFEDCLFELNQAASGAGVSVESGSRPLFIRTTFRDNFATSSGAVLAVLSAPVFIDCVFERNTSLGAGAIRTLSSSFTVIGGTFAGNISTSDMVSSGGITISGAPWMGIPMLIANSLFVGNEGTAGGALLAIGVNPGDAQIANSTFAGNVARESGGSVYSWDADGLEMNNVIFWGNQAPIDPEIHVFAGGPPTVERAIVAGGYAPGTDILDQDPLFVRNPDPGPDNQWGTNDDNYGDLRLLEGSPAIDFGLEQFLPADIWDLDEDGNTTEPLPIDLSGDVRVQGGNVDLGAYEGPGFVAGELGLPERPEMTLRVFPNPASSSITVQTEFDLITIVDVLGRLVLATKSIAGEMTLNVSELSPGVYFVRDGSESRVITIQR